LKKQTRRSPRNQLKKTTWLKRKGEGLELKKKRKKKMSDHDPITGGCLVWKRQAAVLAKRWVASLRLQRRKLMSPLNLGWDVPMLFVVPNSR
jgi:hypothetical protein